MKQPCVYIVASKLRGTLYTGVTANLPRRAFEHREGLVRGFSTKYGCKILVWYELHESMIEAIAREKAGILKPGVPCVAAEAIMFDGTPPSIVA